MARTKLKTIGSEERHTYTCTFERYGSKKTHGGHILSTILLVDVRDSNGKKITVHLWFNFTKGFQKARLRGGELVQFDARVAKYQRGYLGHREGVDVPVSEDYKLSFPTKVKVISRKR